MTDVRTRGALVAAVLVGAFLLVREIIGNIIGLLYESPLTNTVAQVGSTTLDLFVRIIPVAVGVFLVFWRFLAPITVTLSVRQVLVRSLVATAAGSVIAGLIDGIFSVSQGFTGSLFGDSFPYAAVGNAFGGILIWITSLVTSYVALVPLVALAAVLLWLWLRHKHP